MEYEKRELSLHIMETVLEKPTLFHMVPISNESGTSMIFEAEMIIGTKYWVYTELGSTLLTRSSTRIIAQAARTTCTLPT